MIENFQDAVAISRVHGCPDLFSTFTCNPKWPEITEALSVEPGQRPHNRADIIVRVYHMKLNEHLEDIKTGVGFGPVVAGAAAFLIRVILAYSPFSLPVVSSLPTYFFPVLHTVEFQKRGLPHAHILTWQDKDKRGEVSPTLIDSYVSAEIPDPVADPLGYALVAEFMMHGPCGEDGPRCHGIHY